MMDNFTTKIVPFYPIYARAPNKLLRYEERPFTCKPNKRGIERVAIFQDSKKNIQEMTAQVIWLEDVEPIRELS
jgi:hypothetical protein